VILIKSKKEIDYIRESCKILAETLQLLKANVKEGITTLELDKIAEDYIRSNNALPAFKGYSQGGAPGFPGINPPCFFILSATSFGFKAIAV